MKNALHKHGSYVCALTHSAARHVSSKKETHEVVICVFTQVWVSVFRCICTFYMPFFHHSWTRTHTHTIYTQTCSRIDAHFPWCCFSKGGKQQWSGTGLFFSAGQILARPKGGSHPIPPEVPLVWDPFEPPPAGRTSL